MSQGFFPVHGPRTIWQSFAMDSRKKKRETERCIRQVQEAMQSACRNRSGNAADGRATRPVQTGDTVRVDFLAWTEDGNMIECSLYGDPLTFTVGQRVVMQGMEDLVIGMRVGESKTEKIAPERAFGVYREDLVCQVSVSWLQAQDVSPAVGLHLEVRKTDGVLVPMAITEIKGDRVTLDANHRFAGQSVVVQLDLLDILDPAKLDLDWKSG